MPSPIIKEIWPGEIRVRIGPQYSWIVEATKHGGPLDETM